MRAVDWVWTAATVGWVVGCVTIGLVIHRWRRGQPTVRVVHTMEGPRTIRGSAEVLRHVRVVQLRRRPPYDWATDGD